MGESGFGIREVRIRGFRSVRSVGFRPGPVCALVGGPSVGKSNVLDAIRMLLEDADAAPAAADATRGAPPAIEITATLADGDEISLEATANRRSSRAGPSLPVVFLPASERSGRLVTPARPASRGASVVRRHFPGADGAPSSAASAATLVSALESLIDAREHGLVVLIEEPELFLGPQSQRYLYRLLRSFAEAGNQVLYSTHSPAFLNVGRLGELALVEIGERDGTTITQPEPLSDDDRFRAVNELDAERSELLLARAVLLVEGRTEKLSFPFIFRTLGHDPDREGITVVECGGKSNILLFVRICQATHIPYVVVHDRDARPGRRPIRGERVLNAQIANLAGVGSTIVLAPDFEAVAGLRARSHKPAHAWERFAAIEPGQVPAPLRRAVEQVVRAARG